MEEHRHSRDQTHFEVSDVGHANRQTIREVVDEVADQGHHGKRLILVLLFDRLWRDCTLLLVLVLAVAVVVGLEVLVGYLLNQKESPYPEDNVQVYLHFFLTMAVAVFVAVIMVVVLLIVMVSMPSLCVAVVVMRVPSAQMRNRMEKYISKQPSHRK